jgi:hypothetical protein
MRSYRAKSWTSALAALLALGLWSTAPGQDEFTEIIEEPLQGTSAELDNEQDFEEATTSLATGLLTLEDVILDEGLMRAINNDAVIGGSSNQDLILAAAETLQACKDTCQAPEERCSDRADPAGVDLSILDATSCEIRAGRCQVRCTQDLVNVVASIPNISGNTAEAQNDEDPAMEQQRDEAAGAILLRNLREADLAVQQGLSDLQTVALEEGIRTTLDEYEEYGVPAGPTRVATASNNLTECSTDTLVQTGECIDDTCLAQFGSPDPGVISSFLVTLCSYQCELVGAIRQFDCAEDVVDRFLD